LALLQIGDAESTSRIVLSLAIEVVIAAAVEVAEVAGRGVAGAVIEGFALPLDTGQIEGAFVSDRASFPHEFQAGTDEIHATETTRANASPNTIIPLGVFIPLGVLPPPASPRDVDVARVVHFTVLVVPAQFVFFFPVAGISQGLALNASPCSAPRIELAAVEVVALFSHTGERNGGRRKSHQASTSRRERDEFVIRARMRSGDVIGENAAVVEGEQG
jgi:hypothetical protein